MYSLRATLTLYMARQKSDSSQVSSAALVDEVRIILRELLSKLGEKAYGSCI